MKKKFLFPKFKFYLTALNEPMANDIQNQLLYVSRKGKQKKKSFLEISERKRLI